MAKVLNYESQIQQGEIVQSWHVSQSVDAFTGAEDYAISISGSVNLTSSFSIAPGNLLTTGQCQYLSYNPTTGQVFRADTASLDSKMHDGFHVYKTGSNDNNIVPAKFGNNKASANYAVVGGGLNNTASAGSTFIGGGVANTASAGCAIIGGGRLNSVPSGATFGAILGGCSNAIGTNGCFSAIVGGQNNTISGNDCLSFLGGGQNNTLNGKFSTLVGGVQNCILGDCEFVGGGKFNTSSAALSSIVGGNSNKILENAESSFLGGGD